MIFIIEMERCDLWPVFLSYLIHDFESKLMLIFTMKSYNAIACNKMVYVSKHEDKIGKVSHHLIQKWGTGWGRAKTGRRMVERGVGEGCRELRGKGMDSLGGEGRNDVVVNGGT